MQTDTTFDVIFLRMDRLPTLPGIAIRLLEAVQKENPDLKEIGNLWFILRSSLVRADTCISGGKEMYMGNRVGGWIQLASDITNQ